MTEKLCYIEGTTAYFTTQELCKQRGDDWNDAPYEHNAGEPYTEEGYEITTVMFSGDFALPSDHHNNSPYSVDDINAFHVAWLRTESWIEPSGALLAGSSLEEFITFVEKHGGTVYLPRKEK